MAAIIEKNSLKTLLSEIGEIPGDEVLQRLIVSAEDISETLCFISRLPEAISHKQASDRYYLDLDIDESLLPLTRMNYYLSRETGMLLTYGGDDIYGCLYSFTFEEFLAMGNEFEEFVESLRSLEPLYRERKLNGIFRNYLETISECFHEFFHLQQQVIALLTEKFDKRFAKVQAIFRHYIDMVEMAADTRVKLEIFSESEKSSRRLTLQDSLLTGLENLSVLRGLTFAHKGALWHFDVILESLERVENNLDSLSGEIEFLAKDLR